jgi:uncharacterized protein with ATP-grasp and redox domains
MQTYLDCYPCFLRQALQAARFAGASEPQQKTVLDGVLDVLKEASLSATPPEVAARVHRIVRQEVGDGDPYRSAKEHSTQEALALYPRLKALVAEADDPLETAVRLSIAGNIIDFGAVAEYDLWGTVERVLTQPFAIDDGVALREALAGAREVLYLADNAGETVFDRVLIETLDVPVVYAVKGGVVLNDATREDAEAVGLDKVSTVVDNGASTMGTILSRCSAEFRRRFAEAELVMAKGQANYETLSEQGPKVFFLLQAKCSVIARDIGVEVGSIMLEQGQ